MKKCALCFVITAICMLILAGPTYAESGAAAEGAATEEYQEITFEPVQAGGFYFKKVDAKSGYNIARSQNADSGYTSVLKDIDVVYVSDKYLMTLRHSKKKTSLVRYSLAGKNKKVIKKLSGADGYDKYWTIGTVAGKNVLLSFVNYKKLKATTYRLNLKTKKLVKIMDKCNLRVNIGDERQCVRSGEYIVGENNVIYSLGLPAQTLYRITSAGKLKTVQKLGKRVQAGFVDDHLYYVKFGKEVYVDGFDDYDYDDYDDYDYDDYDDEDYDDEEDYFYKQLTGKVYRCNRDGSNEVCLGSFELGTDDIPYYWVHEFESDDVLIYSYEKIYRFDYATGILEYYCDIDDLYDEE